MVDNYPNLQFHRHAEVELLHNDGVHGGDLLADSANGTALDPDLECILRKDRFLAFIDSKDISQVVERLREDDDEFDIAGQMAEAIRVSLDDYEDPEEGWKPRKRSERLLAIFDVMANLATPEEMERFLRNCMLKRLRNEWSGSLNVLPKRYNYLGYSNSSEEKPGGPKKLKLLTRYVLGQVIEEGKRCLWTHIGKKLRRSLKAIMRLLSLRKYRKYEQILLSVSLYLKNQLNRLLWML